MTRPSAPSGSARASLSRRVAVRLTPWVVRHDGAILLLTGLLTVVSSFLLLWLRLDVDLVSMLPRGRPRFADYQELVERFGSQDVAVALVRAPDRARAIRFGDADLPIIGVLMVSFLGTMALVAQRGHLHWPHFAALGVAAALFVWQQWLMRGREREACLRAFRNNNWVGLALWVGIVLSYALK